MGEKDRGWVLPREEESRRCVLSTRLSECLSPLQSLGRRTRAPLLSGLTANVSQGEPASPGALNKSSDPVVTALVPVGEPGVSRDVAQAGMPLGLG